MMFALIGCAQSNSTICGTLVCVEGSVCSPDGTRCAAPSQLTACEGQDDGAGCSFIGEPSGSCSGGVCLPVGCGNGVVEPQLNEVCDDGNRTSFDGCSADCTSAEMCGDGAVDVALGEQCDCGSAGQTVAGCLGPNAMDPGAMCRTDCKLARCGDGVVDPEEVCDDGNNVAGDGCRADCRGRWTAMASGTFASLQAVWGNGPTDVYAVGTNGTIIHYDGTTWAPLQTLGDIAYKDIWGVGTDVFAIGYVNDPGFGRVDRLDGQTFSVMHAYPTGMQVDVIHGQSATNFWVGVFNGSSMTLQHYVGGGWPSTSFTCSGSGGGAGSLWTDASGKAWVTTANGDTCVYNGTSTWTLAAGAGIKTIWGISATELYGTNDSSREVRFTTNGTAWNVIPNFPTAMEPYSVGGVAGDIVFVGADGSIGMFDGVSSVQIEQAPLPFDLNDVWVYAKGRGFIVGDNGTILY